MHEDCVLDPTRSSHERGWDIGVQEKYSPDGRTLPLQVSHVERQQEALVPESPDAGSRYLHVPSPNGRADTGAPRDDHPTVSTHLVRQAVDHRPDAACMLGGGCVDERDHGRDCEINSLPQTPYPGGKPVSPMTRFSVVIAAYNQRERLLEAI